MYAERVWWYEVDGNAGVGMDEVWLWWVQGIWVVHMVQILCLTQMTCVGWEELVKCVRCVCVWAAWVDDDWVWALPILWKQGECWTCIWVAVVWVLSRLGPGSGGVVLCLCEMWVWILCVDGRSRYLCNALGGYLLLLFAFRDLWKEMGWFQFSDPYRIASSTTGGWSRWNILMCYIYIYIYILSTFLDLTDVIFLQGLPFFVYIPIFASTLCMCVMYLTSIWRILLMTDGLKVVWSNDRAAPTDTNPKNLELAPPQSVRATRLDQLVYYYIQIFRLNRLPAVRIEPSTARSKLKSNALTDCAMGAILWRIPAHLRRTQCSILLLLRYNHVETVEEWLWHVITLWI